MVNPGLILECVLVSVVIVIVVLALACWSGGDDDTRSHDQEQRRRRQAADDEEAVKKKQMAAVAMALLDCVTYSQAGGRSVEEDCAICLGQFEDGDRCSIMPLCRHEFHRTCIADWIMAYNNTCPLCRGQLQWSAVAENMV